MSFSLDAFKIGMSSVDGLMTYLTEFIFLGVRHVYLQLSTGMFEFRGLFLE